MNTHADRNIDTVLTGLRTTNTPAGLETRIHARLAQTAELPIRATSLNAVIPTSLTTVIPRSLKAAFLTLSLPKGKYPRILLGAPIRLAWAATATAAIAVAFLATHHQTTTVAEQSASTPTPQTLSPRSQPAAAQVPPRFSVGSHAPSISKDGALASDSPDAIALAETLAPSHPAPPLPLTAEEALLLRATRPGQPIEVAELDSVREPILHALAEQREHTNIGQYIHALLAPLAAAEALSPTPAPPDETQPVTVAEAPSSK